MKELLDAIELRFAAVSGLSATITGGIHLVKAPVGTSKPYLVITPIAAPTTDAFGTTTQHYEALIQFQVFGSNARTTMVAMDAVTAGFDNHKLDLSPGSKTCFGMWREDDPIVELDPEKDSNVGYVSQSRCTYHYLVQ